VSPEPEALGLTLEVGGSKFELRHGNRYTVGCDPACDLRVIHQSIASNHCAISCENGLAIVHDLGSASGTFVDGRRIEKQVILLGQGLRFGAIEVRVLAPESSAAAVALVTPSSRRSRLAPPPFAELMAQELKRAPWFTLSALIHMIAILILYQLMEQAVGAPVAHATLTLSRSDEDSDFEDAASPPAPEVQREQEVLEQLEDPFADEDSGIEAGMDTPVEFRPSDLSSGLHWLTRLRGGGGDGEDPLSGASTPFRDKAAEDRRRGLEIVFVFDSTSTMGEMIHATKRRIESMVEVLHALVPSARIGVVTYRDRGPNEEYLTRQVPLGRDVSRVINFMQVIEARDGDDRPEAVLDGLRQAFAQTWHRRSRRVVVLIGDAPAHAYDEIKIARLVRGFVNDGRSSVHSIVVSPYGGGVVLDDALRSFRRIADYGRGKCLRFENESLIMQQVLSLAFGTEYRADLDRVAEIVRGQENRINPKTRDLLRRRDTAEIDRQLHESTVPDDLVRALAQSEDKLLAMHLVDVLEQPGFPESGRQAAAYALSRILDGQLEPTMRQVLASASREGTDPRRMPWSLGAISARKARFLRQLIDEL